MLLLVLRRAVISFIMKAADAEKGIPSENFKILFMCRRNNSLEWSEMMGILICGLNGTGKSTLGKALAERLQSHFIDIENLYFPKKDPDYLYDKPRTREEVARLLIDEMKAHEDFVLASGKGDYGEAVTSLFQCVVLLIVPKEIRMQRVKERSFQKFGRRMSVGGDLYEREEKFFRFVESRAENEVEEWVKTLQCPVIRFDGTKPIEENVNFIIEYT